MERRSFKESSTLPTTMVAISTRFGFSRFTGLSNSILILCVYFSTSHSIQSLSLFTTNPEVSTFNPTGVKKGDVFSNDLDSFISHYLLLKFYFTYWGYLYRWTLGFFASLSSKLLSDISCCRAACLAFKSSHRLRGEVYIAIQRVK